jgi:hypothetical protein
VSAIKNLREWRSLKRKTYIIAGGLEIVTRDVNLVDLVAQGLIPKPLLGMIEALNKRSAQGDQQVRMEEFNEYAEMINAVVRAMVVSPPILATKEIEQIHDQIAALFEDGIGKSQIRSWIDSYLIGEEPAPELDFERMPKLKTLVDQLATSLSMNDIPLTNKIEMFQSVAAEAAGFATFPQQS